MTLFAFAAILALAAGGGSTSADIVLQSGHGANISALAFSPDGSYLVSASEDATLKLWNPETGVELRTLRGHTNIVTSLALSVDGSLIASASLDHTLRVWNAATGESITVLRGPQPTVYLLKMTPDGSSLITAETVAAGSILRFWDIKTGKQMRLIKRDEAAVSHIFFSGSSTMMVADESGDDDATGALTTYDWRSGRLLQTRREVLCGASDNGKWMAVDRSTQAARKAMIVDLPHDKPFAELSGQVSRVMFSTTGEWLAYESSAGDTAVVRRTAGGPARTIHGRGAEFSMLALSPDGRWLASAGADFSIHLWDVENGKLAHGMAGQYTPTAMAFSPDGRRVVVNGGGTDLGSALEVWDIERRIQVAAPRVKHSVSGLAVSKDGAYVAVSGASVEVFDLRTNAPVAEMDCGATAASYPAFSSNGKWVAARCNGVVRVWSLAGGAELFHVGEEADANAGPLAFSADGKYLAAASGNGLKVYEVLSRKMVQSVVTGDPVAALSFSGNGDLLAFGTRLATSPKPNERTPTLYLLDVHSHRKLWAVAAGQWVSALQFEREGNALVVAAGDDPRRSGGLLVVEASSGRVIRRLDGKVPSAGVSSLSPNGEWFGAGWNSGTSLWRLAYH